MNIPANLLELVKEGALIIDLRRKDEFEKEHISDSLNIPFDRLNSKLLKSNFVKFRQKEVIIVCSAKAAESKAAKDILESQGMKRVYDGGDWIDLKLLLAAKKG